jgi:hypothetical protein
MEARPDAIIRKKGSGKSALADIIALLGRTHIDPKDYSFLKPDKFRKGVIATEYSADLTWADDSAITDFCLNHDVNAQTEPERVRYLPQVYVDRLCNEVGVSDKFQTEINKVVYSYLPKSERQGASTLTELIAKRTGAIEAELSTLREQLDRLIVQRIAYEKRSQPSHKELLKNKLKELQKECDSIVIPQEVKKPSSEPDEKTKKEIMSLKEKLATVERGIADTESQLESATKRRTAIHNIQGHLKNLVRQVEVFMENVSDDLQTLGINRDDILTFEVKQERLTKLEAEVGREIQSLNVKLGPVKAKELASSEIGQSVESPSLTTCE